MNKLLLLLLLFSLSSLNAMYRFTAHNNTGNTIEIGGIILSPGESKQLCSPESTITMYTKERGVDNVPVSITVDKETTLLKLDRTALLMLNPTQVKSRPLIIRNDAPLALILAIRRPGYGICQDDIPCPEKTDIALTIPADADQVDIRFQSNSHATGPNLSSKLEDHFHGLYIGDVGTGWKSRHEIVYGVIPLRLTPANSEKSR